MCFSNRFFSAAIALAASIQSFANNTTYYVSSENGNDSAYTGTSRSQPWKTLEKVSATTFGPGDKILFKSGNAWTGQLVLNGSGVSGSPIIIDTFDLGDKPAIDGNGITGTTFSNAVGVVSCNNISYWEINNLDLTNKYGTATYSSGIIAKSSGSTHRHLYIKNCSIHNITIGGEIFASSATEKNLGGINIRGAWDSVLIDGNIVAYAGRTGIVSTAGNATDKTNLIIRNNVVSYSAGDGIVALGCTGALIEHNVVHHCGYGSNGTRTDWSAGIWGGWYANKLTFQYNEAYSHYYPSGDGEGFDIDSYSPNSIYQYNYSHDNEGGFMLTMGDGCNIDSSVVRYNISLNEIIGDWRGGTYIWVYNNIFARTDSVTSTFPHTNSLKATFAYNNIFYSHSGSQIYSLDASVTHSNNLYYPAGSIAETGAVTSDPQFVSAPRFAPIGRLNITGLSLKASSPAINAGIVIANNGGHDYWGNTLYQGLPDIGAQEYHESTASVNPRVETPAHSKGSDSPFLAQVGQTSARIEECIADKTPLSIYDISGHLIKQHIVISDANDLSKVAGKTERSLVLSPEN